MSKIGKSTETESRLVVPKAGGGGSGHWEKNSVTVHGYRDSFRGEGGEMYKIDCGDNCPTSWFH